MPLPDKNFTKKLVFIGFGFFLLIYCLNLFLYYYSIDNPLSLYRVTYLEKQLDDKVYGQHIATRNIAQSLKLHFMMPVKATALVLHGEKGTGKSHFVKILKDTLYNPENVHTFAPEDLPKNQEYQKRVMLDKIDKQIGNHPQSLFIFEHVEKMSPVLLNALQPYLDYTYFNRDNNLKKPVFIFVSTTSTTSDIIMKKLFNDFYKSGNSRSTASLDDFEEYLKKFLYNKQKGGLFGSKLIQKNLIDHFIPFLPLEKDHIKNCIRDNFLSKELTATEKHINEVLSYIEWAPDREKVYAVGGCRGVNQKVILVKNKYNLQKD